MTALRIPGLAALVIFTAHDEDFARLFPLGLDRVNADVVIRIVHVPIEPARDRGGGDPRADDIGHVGRHFRVHEHAVVHGRIRGNDDRLCRHLIRARDYMSVLRPLGLRAIPHQAS